MNCRRRPMRPSRTDSELRRENPRGKDQASHYDDKHGMERSTMPLPPKEKGRVVQWGGE